MIKFLSALVVGLGLLTAPVMAQDCLSPAMVTDNAEQFGVTTVHKEVTGTELDTLKKVIADEYQLPLENLVFDLVIAYEIDVASFPELEGMVYVVLFKDGCAINAFPEDKATFDARFEG